jgi:DNA-binding response OmpR family regulator
MTDEAALVLVVDDNEMNRDMLSRRLKRQNYEVLMAEDGEKALEMIAAHPFDLVLLDIMMPRVSGYEVLERVKKDERTRSLPVIMISAVDDLESVVKCIEMGAEDYLFKPFNPVLLKARVSASLEKNRLRKDSLQSAAPHIRALQTEVDALRATGLDAAAAAAVERLQSHVTALLTMLDQPHNQG